MQSGAEAQPGFLPVAGGWSGPPYDSSPECSVQIKKPTQAGVQMSLAGWVVLLTFSIINVTAVKDIFCKYVHRRKSLCSAAAQPGGAHVSFACLLSLLVAADGLRPTASQKQEESAALPLSPRKGRPHLPLQAAAAGKPPGVAPPVTSVSPEVFPSKQNQVFCKYMVFLSS